MSNPADSLIRMLLRFGVAVAVVGWLGMPVSAATSAVAAAQPEEQSEEGEEPEGGQGAEAGEGEQPSAAELGPALETKAKSKAKAKKRGKRGRVGHVVREESLRRRLPPPPSGNLHLYRPLDRESLKVNIYN